MIHTFFSSAITSLFCLEGKSVIVGSSDDDTFVVVLMCSKKYNFVNLYYKINNYNEAKITMNSTTEYNLTWRIELNVKKTDSINFFFEYFDISSKNTRMFVLNRDIRNNNLQVHTTFIESKSINTQTITFSNDKKKTSSYNIVYIEYLDDKTCNIRFIPKIKCVSVYLHYKVDEKSQKKERMNMQKNEWNYSFPFLKNNNTEFSFVYMDKIKNISPILKI